MCTCIYRYICQHVLLLFLLLFRLRSPSSSSVTYVLTLPFFFVTYVLTLPFFFLQLEGAGKTLPCAICSWPLSADVHVKGCVECGKRVHSLYSPPAGWLDQGRAREWRCGELVEDEGLKCRDCFPEDGGEWKPAQAPSRAERKQIFAGKISFFRFSSSAILVTPLTFTSCPPPTKICSLWKL
jgi:hypothetical protein